MKIATEESFFMLYREPTGHYGIEFIGLYRTIEEAEKAEKRWSEPDYETSIVADMPLRVRV